MIHPVQSLSHRSVISIFLMNFLLEFFGSAWRSFGLILERRIEEVD